MERKRGAFTLIEVVIASSLFLFVLGIVVGYQVYIRQGQRSQRKGLFMSTATLLFTQLQRDGRSAIEARCADGRVDLVVRGASGLETISYSYRVEEARVERESGMGKTKKVFDFSGWAEGGQKLELSFSLDEVEGRDGVQELVAAFRLREGDRLVDRLEKRLMLEQLRPRRKLNWARPDGASGK